MEKLSTQIHPSGLRLFPSYKIDIEEFLNDISSREEIIKIRDTNANTINVKKLVTAINGYITLRKYTQDELSTRKEGKENVEEGQLERLIELLNPETLLSLYSRWNKLFLFAHLHANGNEIAKRLKDNITQGLKKLSVCLEEKEKFNCDLISREIIRNYRDLVVIAEASYKALCGVDSDRTKECKMAVRLRKANLMDYTAISLPLSNYIKDLPTSFNLTGMPNLETLSMISKNGFGSFDLSPRFIHLGEYMMFRQIVQLYDGNEPKSLEGIVADYYSVITQTFDKTDNPITIETQSSKNSTYTNYIINVEDNYYPKKWYNDGIYVGLANVNLSKHNLTQTKKKKTILDLSKIHSPERKRELINLLNDCFINQKTYYYYYEFSKKKAKKKLAFIEEYKKPISYLVFPETYLPIAWIPILIKYSRNCGTVVVTGVKYIDIQDRIVNLQAVIVPFTTKDHHRQAVVVFREKNNYAPFEKEIISNSKKHFKDHDKPVYYTFNHRGISFSAFVCYELTDIFARALIRNKAEIVFSSEYNRDINYFSNIVESTSRDLSAFVVKVNSSDCGDTRIVAPYRDKYKNIASISGGEKDSIHIGKINIAQQRKYMKDYKSHNIDSQYSSLDEKYPKNKKPSAGTR